MSKIYTFLQIIQEKTLFLENLLPPVMTVTTNVTSESDKSNNQSNIVKGMFVCFIQYLSKQITDNSSQRSAIREETAHPPKKMGLNFG